MVPKQSKRKQKGASKVKSEERVGACLEEKTYTIDELRSAGVHERRASLQVPVEGTGRARRASLTKRDVGRWWTTASALPSTADGR